MFGTTKWLGISGLIVTLLTVFAHAQDDRNVLPRLGTNVAGLHQLSSTMPFTDLFKVTSGWFTSCEYDWIGKKAIDPGCTPQNSFNTREQHKLDLDEHGWVRSLPNSDDAEIFTSVISGLHLDNDFPLGRYILLYSGKGKIEVSGAVNIIEEKPGRTVFDLIATRMGLKIKISQLHKRNYIRDIHVVSAANEESFKDNPFDVDYVDRLKPFEAIRFMPWSNPRNNQSIDWADASTPETARYTGNTGVPVKTMIDLANSIEAAPWLTMPYKASDDFIKQYAKMARKHVKRDKKIYIELSNEMWNIIFPATSHAIAGAKKLWPNAYSKEADYKRKVKLASNWYGKRTVEMCDIWKRVFSRYPDRVVCVIAAQSNVDWVGKEVLDCPLWLGGPCASKVHAYAVGPYFGDYIAKKEHRKTVTQWARSEDGMDKLFKEIEQGSVLPNGPKGGAIQHFVDTKMKTSMQLADDYGLPLLAYEAGQHLIRFDHPHQINDSELLDFFKRANDDPRMEAAYQRYLKAWEENGGKTLIHFYGIGKASSKDFFSMLPSSSAKTSPKYNALMQYLRAKNKDQYPHSKALGYREINLRREQAREAALKK